MGENFYYNVGQNLQRIRKEKGYITPEKVVELYDLAFPNNKIANSTKGQNISKFENGKNASGKGNLDLATIAALASVLHVSIDSLVYGDTNKENKKDSPAEPAEKPIEGYTMKDICIAFKNIANFCDMKIEPQQSPESRRNNMVHFGDRLFREPFTVTFSPKKQIFMHESQKMTCIDRRASTLRFFIDDLTSTINRFVYSFDDSKTNAAVNQIINSMVDAVPAYQALTPAAIGFNFIRKMIQDNKLYGVLPSHLNYLVVYSIEKPDINTSDFLKNLIQREKNKTSSSTQQ